MHLMETSPVIPDGLWRVAGLVKLLFILWGFARRKNATAFKCKITLLTLDPHTLNFVNLPSTLSLFIRGLDFALVLAITVHISSLKSPSGAAI